MRRAVLGAVCVTVLLSACGGGSGSNNATSTTPPTSATTATTKPSFTGTTVKPVDPGVVGDTMLRLDAPGRDFGAGCQTLRHGSSQYPKWAVNATAVITCNPPSLPGAGVLGAIFGNADDLHTTLLTYNQSLLLDPNSADTVCPPTNGGPSGVVLGDGKGGADSVLECRRLQGANQPEIIWTSLPNHELWAAQGPVGMSDADLLAWYRAKS